MASGTLSFDASAVYNFQAAASYNPAPVVLSTKTYTSVYYIGTVPVYQEVTLSVSATITATASAAINASTEAKASETVTVGVTYNPATGQWTPVFNQTHSQSLTAQLTINGGVTAEVRLIPEIDVKFYKVVAGALSVEPYLDGNIQAAQISSNPVILAGLAPSLLEPTQFDVSLGVQANVSASLTTLWRNITLLPKTTIASGTIPLFGLPTLQLQGGGGSMAVGQAQTLTLSVTNGVSDNFNPASIQWKAIPNNSASVAGITNQGCTPTQTGYTCSASMTSQNADTYNVVASGYGMLGTVATQYAITDITLTSSCSIGSPGPAGGIIFYISSTSPCHGMEVAPTDQAIATWGCWAYDPSTNWTWTVVGSTSVAIGTGAANTAAIIAACGSTVSGDAYLGIPAGQNAAAAASAYSLNGYTDWYLPSLDELYQLYINQDVVLLLPGPYWSSSAYNSVSVYAWVQDSGDGNQIWTEFYSTERVRAVRTF